jgi:hypothetical protein
MMVFRNFPLKQFGQLRQLGQQQLSISREKERLLPRLHKRKTQNKLKWSKLA